MSGLGTVEQNVFNECLRHSLTYVFLLAMIGLNSIDDFTK